MIEKSARDLGIQIGKYPTGKYNNITDVLGVKVGHTTLIQDESIRTGVTVVKPSESIFENRFACGSFILNGAGEVSGLAQLDEWGLIETPIALTNTMSVGKVSETLCKLHKAKGVIIPVVGECDDSFLNDVSKFPLNEDHVSQAFQKAHSGAFQQGSVGAGTGMICCDFKGGIGSSSRIIDIEGGSYTIGVLSLTNFGHMEDLRVDGHPIGKLLAPMFSDYKRRKEKYGSIITIIATDLPLNSHQLTRLCKRAALGIGRTGSYAAHESGEIILAFSTANNFEQKSSEPLIQLNYLRDQFLNIPYQAVLEATEESIINSLTYSSEMIGFNGHKIPRLPHAELTKVYEKFKKVSL